MHFAYVSNLVVSEQYGKNSYVSVDFPVHHQTVGIMSLERGQ